LSPDGKRLAVNTIGIESPRSSVSIYDFGRGVLSTLTPEPGRHFASAWSSDGRRIAFTTFEEANPRLSWKAVDGSGGLEFLSPGGFPEFPTSWSPDGRTLLYTTAMSGSLENMDIWYASSESKGERRAWLSEPSREFAAFFSPDGRTVAYVSDESGKNEVYLRPFHGPGGKVKVSTNGGAEPAWASTGRELFYRTSDTLMSAPVEPRPELSVGVPRAVLTDRYDRWGREDVSRNYDVSADGTRFLVIKSQEVKLEPVTQLNLVSNWPAELAGSGASGR
jgi:serine/threonine-protein kinase